MLNNIAAQLATVGGLTPAAGYTLQLDASNAGSFSYSSGSIVSEWRDLSGNAYHFAQGSVSFQPDRQNNIQNGLPSVYFNSDNLTNSSWNWSSSDYTVFFVVKNRTITSYDGILGRNDTESLLLGFDNTNKYAISKTGITTATSNLSGTGSNSDVVVYKGSAITAGATTVQIYKNGTAASSTLSLTGLIAGATNVLGAGRSISGDPMIGYLSEVLIYPSQLSDTNRNQTEAYLKAKWATP